MDTITAVRRTRRVSDLIRGKNFVAVKRFPGGREIKLGAAKTRTRARKIAQYANRPNGSSSAGGTYVEGYDATAIAGAGAWKFGDPVY